MRKQRWYCPICKKVRIASIEIKGKNIKITDSQGHIIERESVLKEA